MLMALTACSQTKSAATHDPEVVKAQREPYVAALAHQLEMINYKATVADDGDKISVRVGQSPVKEVRRAICRQMGWPTAQNEMIRIGPTLKGLRECGVTRIKIVSDTEHQDVDLGPDGQCLKSQ